MDEFSVIITPDAEKDLNELDDYITFSLNAPDVAVSYIREIKEKLLTLRNNPKRYHLVDDEPWHTRGVRRMKLKGMLHSISFWISMVKFIFKTSFIRKEISTGF